MAYGNYQQQGTNRGGYNREGYNRNYSNTEPIQQQPKKTPQEFVKERLDMLMMFIDEGEKMGFKGEELLKSNLLGGWITSYLSFEAKGNR